MGALPNEDGFTEKVNEIVGRGIEWARRWQAKERALANERGKGVQRLRRPRTAHTPAAARARPTRQGSTERPRLQASCAGLSTHTLQR